MTKESVTCVLEATPSPLLLAFALLFCLFFKPITNTSLECEILCQASERASRMINSVPTNLPAGASCIFWTLLLVWEEMQEPLNYFFFSSL